MIDTITEIAVRLMPYAIVVAIVAVGILASWSTIAGAWERRPSWLANKNPVAKKYWKNYIKLLSNEKIAETYTPSQTFVENFEAEEEQKRRATNAWLSPFSKAVKASSKRYGRTPKGQYFNARRQIRELSKRISIRDLNERELNENGGTTEDQFVVVLALDGKTHEEITKLGKNIKSQLGLATVQQLQNKNAYAITFLAKYTDEDPMTQLKPNIEFFNENPAPHWSKLPIGVKTNGEPWYLPLHHTMILGQTGSGKGSAIHAIIRQLLPTWEKGLVQFYGIDPKGTELRPYQQTTIFKQVAIDPNAQPEVIEAVYQEMTNRTGNKKIDLQTGNLERSFKISRSKPVVVLIIDEFLSVLLQWKTLGQEGKRLLAMLTQILAQGRSEGVYVITATQDADKTEMGNLRNNIANTIVLKQDSVYMNDFFLGAEASKNGYDSTQIAPSNHSNNFATAGIGYAKDEGGEPVKIRLAYLGDADIADAIKEHERAKPQPFGMNPQGEEPYGQQPELDTGEGLENDEDGDEDDLFKL